MELQSRTQLNTARWRDINVKHFLKLTFKGFLPPEFFFLILPFIVEEFSLN